MAELAQRTTICEMRSAWSSVSDIIKSTGYVKSTVYQVVSAFDDEGKVRSDPKRTKTFLAGLKRTMKSDPSQPMSKLAQKSSVSRSTISRAVKEYFSSLSITAGTVSTSLNLTLGIKSRNNSINSRFRIASALSNI